MIHTARTAILAFLHLTLAVGAESYGNAIAFNASAENVVWGNIFLWQLRNPGAWIRRSQTELRLGGTRSLHRLYPQQPGILYAAQHYTLKANRPLIKAVLSHHNSTRQVQVLGAEEQHVLEGPGDWKSQTSMRQLRVRTSGLMMRMLFTLSTPMPT